MEQSVFNGELSSIGRELHELSVHMATICQKPIWYQDPINWNTTVLAFTLIILVIYTYYTYKIFKQTKESNLRPVIFRSGYVTDWNSVQYEIRDSLVQGRPLEFKILRNISTNIRGRIIINGTEYPLLWGSNITQQNVNSWRYLPLWGWVNNGEILSAVFNPNEGRESSESNQIIIEYSDIEGNHYRTVEDVNFIQRSYVMH